MSNQDQQHPREAKDRTIINNLLQSQPTEYNLAELARLNIRYQNFPGARAIQQDLQKILHNWELTEEQLYQKTRAAYSQSNIYSDRFKSNQQQDWT